MTLRTVNMEQRQSAHVGPVAADTMHSLDATAEVEHRHIEGSIPSLRDSQAQCLLPVAAPVLPALALPVIPALPPRVPVRGPWMHISHEAQSSKVNMVCCKQ